MEGTTKYLIVTADDFGYSDERDDGIIECFNAGIISHASLMVNGVSCENAAKKAKGAGLPLGLHLNLTEGSTVSSPVPKSLLGQNGFMRGMMGQREAIDAGKLDSSEVAKEIQAQIDKFEKLMGQKPVNVDGHQHIHLYPGILETFSKVMQENGITLTRIPIEPEFSKTSSDHRAGFLNEVIQNSVDSVEMLMDHQIWNQITLNRIPIEPEYSKTSSDHRVGFLNEVIQNSKDSVEMLMDHQIWAPNFTGLKTMGNYMTVQSLIENITEGFMQGASKVTGNQVCELMVHPGKRTGNYGGCGDGPDDFSQSEDREYEMAMLQSEELLNFYKKSNMEFVAFSDILKWKKL